MPERDLRDTVNHLAAQVLELQALATFRKAEVQAIRSFLEAFVTQIGSRLGLHLGKPIQEQIHEWILNDLNRHLGTMADSDPAFASALKQLLDQWIAADVKRASESPEA